MGSHEALQGWAATAGVSLTATVDKLVEDAERQRFWEAMDAYHAELRDSPEALADYKAESNSLAGPVADGLAEWPWEEE